MNKRESRKNDIKKFLAEAKDKNYLMEKLKIFLATTTVITVCLFVWRLSRF